MDNAVIVAIAISGHVCPSRASALRSVKVGQSAHRPRPTGAGHRSTDNTGRVLRAGPSRPIGLASGLARPGNSGPGGSDPSTSTHQRWHVVPPSARAAMAAHHTSEHPGNLLLCPRRVLVSREFLAIPTAVRSRGRQCDGVCGTQSGLWRQPASSCRLPGANRRTLPLTRCPHGSCIDCGHPGPGGAGACQEQYR
eukprot:6486982-Amphidinium_carterae.1